MCDESHGTTIVKTPETRGNDQSSAKHILESSLYLIATQDRSFTDFSDRPRIDVISH